MEIVLKHHVRVFVSDNRCPSGSGFFDDFDLAEFDNDFEIFLMWYDQVCDFCDFNLDYYEVY